jgi:NAD(P)-dependent dehydrogenase (short-subunit alcohol dehydrogenase family)
MGSLDGRVAIITGAGRGLGRAHALLFAAEGARVVVNDIPVGSDRAGPDDGEPAEDVAAEIRAAGGEAIGQSVDAADWEGARVLVDTAIEAYGGVDILVNNAGILRDRLIVNMTESEWDEVIRVHLRGHFCPTHHVAAYWRDEHKAGRPAPRNMINTSSTSGLLANPGQSNYGAAKSGIATFTQIVAKELSRFDVKVNCIAPVARTRLTLATPGLGEIMAARDGTFDEWDPGNVSPVVAYLASTACRFNGETFFVRGGTVQRVRSWELAESVRCEGAWSVDELAEALAKL